MTPFGVKVPITMLLHAFVGWALCGAIMELGMLVASLEAALIAHAVGAPLVFAVISFGYFKRFGYTTPLHTAIVFLSFVIFMDLFVVALLVEQSFAMFASIPGTWLPFALIFLSVYLTGSHAVKRTKIPTKA